MGFATDPYYANKHYVHEFYMNLSIFSLTNPVMKFWGKQVKFGAEQINEIYGLPDDSMEQFQAKSCKLGTLMENVLCPGKEVL